METITIQLCRFLVWFCLLLCVACQSSSTTISLFTPTSTQNTLVIATPKAIASSTPAPTIALLPTIQFIPTATETLTPKPTSTSTPLPTLSPEEAMAEVQRLYETNNGCLLPCWWGITPGETTWGNARYFLSQLVSRISERTNIDFPGIISTEVYLLTGGISHKYIVDDGIVIKMEGYIEMPALFDPTTILGTYGPPTEVRVVGGYNYLDIFLFYPEQGFLLEYQTRNGNTELVNGFQRGCIRPNGVTYIVVWSPAETFTFSERLQQTTHFNADPDPGLPLEEATGMSIETFYQTFQNAEPPVCLETPTNLWVGQ